MDSAKARAWVSVALAPHRIGSARLPGLAAALEGIKDHLDDGEKSVALPALAAHLEGELAAAAFDVAGTLGEPEYRARARVGVWKNAESVRASHQVDTLFETLASVPPSARIELLVDLAQAATGSQALLAWRMALESLKTLELSWSWEREAFMRLIEALPAELVSQAAAIGFGHADGRVRERALTSLGPKLSRELLEYGLRAVRQIGDQDQRAQALVALFPALPAARRAQDGHRLAALVRLIADRLDRLVTLARLAASLDETSADSTWQEILDSLSADLEPYQLMFAMSRLAPMLPGERVDSVLALVRKIPEAHQRAHALIALMRHGEWARDDALAAEAFDTAVQVQPVRLAADPLGELAKLMPATRLNDLRAAVDTLPEGDRLSALRTLALRVEPEDRPAVLKDAFQALVWREYPYHLESGDAVAFFCSFGDDLPDEFLDDVVKYARDVRGPADRVRALTMVARYSRMVEAGVHEEAIAAAVSESDPALRAELLSGLAAFLSPDLVELALAESAQLGSPAKRARSLASLADRLTGDRRVGVYRQALSALGDAAANEDPSGVLKWMIPTLPQELFETALATARGLRTSHSRHDLFRALGSRFSPALAYALVDSSDAELADTAAHCAATLSDDELAAAWTRLLQSIAPIPRHQAVIRLGAAAPIITKLGGESAVQSVYDALQQAARWWP